MVGSMLTGKARLLSVALRVAMFLAVLSMQTLQHHGVFAKSTETPLSPASEASEPYTVSFWFEPIYREIAFQAAETIEYSAPLYINQRVFNYPFRDKAEYDTITDIGLLGPLGFQWFNVHEIISTVWESDLNQLASNRHVFVGVAPPLDMRALMREAVEERETVRIEWYFEHHATFPFRHINLLSPIWNNGVGRTLLNADFFHRQVTIMLEPGQRAHDLDVIQFMTDPDYRGVVKVSELVVSQKDIVEAMHEDWGEGLPVNYVINVRG